MFKLIVVFLISLASLPALAVDNPANKHVTVSGGKMQAPYCFGACITIKSTELLKAGGSLDPEQFKVYIKGGYVPVLGVRTQQVASTSGSFSDGSLIHAVVSSSHPVVKRVYGSMGAFGGKRGAVRDWHKKRPDRKLVFINNGRTKDIQGNLIPNFSQVF